VKAPRNSAFSLIELIVVLLIMGTVGSVVVACFMGGVRAYERARDFGSGEVDAYLTFETMERELKNVVVVPDVPFEGDSMMMRFVTTVSSRNSDGVVGSDVAEVRYWEDGNAGILHSTSLLGDSSGTTADEDMLMRGNVRMRISFRNASEGSSGATWTDSWQSETNLPQQVRIRLAGGDLGESVLERTVLIPIGGE
jgi:prepilin-type N-terminal cleavage/methylation domain-containing protein